jgi:serine/threonine protein kinase/Tol biopolymer transport system component
VPSEPPRVSFAIAVRYRLDENMGTRGRATLYKAFDLKQKCPVMLCIMWPEAAEAIGAELFEREMKAAQALHHPNIVPIHDYGSAYASLYYATPPVTGETLSARLKRDKKLTIEQALPIIKDVAAALQYAHAQGMAHRDLKPDAILLTEDGAQLTDWGVSVAMWQAGTARMREMGMSMGITQYLSPEQATGEHEVTGRSDIFALGSVAYEMITGEAAFRGSTPHAIAAQVVMAHPPSPSQLDPTIPPHVDAAIRTAISKKPEDRFATANVFVEALENPFFTTRTTVALRTPTFATPRSSVAFESGAPPGVTSLPGGASHTPSSSPFVRAITPARASVANLLRASASFLQRASMAVDVRELEAMGPKLEPESRPDEISVLAPTPIVPARVMAPPRPKTPAAATPAVNGAAANGAATHGAPTHAATANGASAAPAVPVTQVRTRTPTPTASSVSGASATPAPEPALAFTPVEPEHASPRRWPLVAAAALLAVVVMGGARYMKRKPVSTAPVVRLTLRIPDTLALVSADLSPDGQRVAYSTTDDALLLGGVGDAAPQLLRANAAEPFYSADGQFVGFTATDDGGRQLRVLPVVGKGKERLLADSAQHGEWGDDQTVYFVRDDGAIARVPAAGGATETLLAANDSVGRVVKLVKVPGQATLLFSFYRGDAEVGAIGAFDLKARKWKRLVHGAEGVAFTPPGYLVFGRGRALMAAPLADDALSLEDEPRQVQAAESDGYQVLVHRGGALLYQPVGVEPQAYPVLRTPGGNERPLPNLSPTVALSYPRVSPDGQVIAFTGKRAGASENDIWVYQLPSGPLRALPAQGNEHPRAFTPDGSRILFSSDRSGRAALYTRPWNADGGVSGALALDADDLLAASLLPDGRHVVFGLLRGDTHAGDLGYAPLARPDSIVMLTAGPYHEWSPAVSPDGKWIAYRTNESGRSEVVVRLLDGGKVTQVSRAGGYLPQWSRTGNALYFESEAGDTLYSAAIDLATTPRVKSITAVAPIVAGRGFDVLPGDQGLVTFRAKGEPKAPPAPGVIVNFRREIEKAFGR